MHLVAVDRYRQCATSSRGQPTGAPHLTTSENWSQEITEDREVSSALTGSISLLLDTADGPLRAASGKSIGHVCRSH